MLSHFSYPSVFLFQSSLLLPSPPFLPPVFGSVAPPLSNLFPEPASALLLFITYRKWKIYHHFSVEIWWATFEPYNCSSNILKPFLHLGTIKWFSQQWITKIRSGALRGCDWQLWSGSYTLSQIFSLSSVFLSLTLSTSHPLTHTLPLCLLWLSICCSVCLVLLLSQSPRLFLGSLSCNWMSHPCHWAPTPEEHRGGHNYISVWLQTILIIR